MRGLFSKQLALGTAGDFCFGVLDVVVLAKLACLVLESEIGGLFFARGKPYANDNHKSDGQIENASSFRGYVNHS